MGFFSKDFLSAWSVGLNFVVSIFVGFGIGYFLDKLFGSSPWLTMIFLVLGIAAGFLELWSFAKRGEFGSDNEDK